MVRPSVPRMAGLYVASYGVIWQWQVITAEAARGPMEGGVARMWKHYMMRVRQRAARNLRPAWRRDGIKRAAHLKNRNITALQLGFNLLRNSKTYRLVA